MASPQSLLPASRPLALVPPPRSTKDLPIQPHEMRGLGRDTRGEWPKVAPQPRQRTIELLRPTTKLHDDTLEYLKKRLRASERRMSSMYNRWRVNEKKIQAFITYQNFEQILKDLNNAGEPPRPVSIVIPYSYATINSITTFFTHVFTGRRPIFSVGSYKEETVQNARTMETVLQFQADATRLVKHLIQAFTDASVYGLMVLRSDWLEQVEMRTQREEVQEFSMLGPQVGTRTEKNRVPTTIYKGNVVHVQSPRMFFPDPNVKMTEVNKNGEYVFWRVFKGRHLLLKMQQMGQVMWVDQVPNALPSGAQDTIGDFGGLEQMTGGHSLTGQDSLPMDEVGNKMQLDQGTIEIIPRELGIGESTRVEKWMFTIANKKQIIQAELYESDHGMHPVAVAEPYGIGHDFGNLGMADYLGPIQDLMGWFFNSHMDNVRRIVNDMIVVDPMMIEMQDLKKPGPGGVIRLKPTALGQDVKNAIFQLPIQDVTKGHVGDFDTLFKIGQVLSAVNENVLGGQSEGGRKTATEVRASNQFGQSRLAGVSKNISATAIVDLSEQMSVNTQQFLDDEFLLMVTGADGQKHPIRVSPQTIHGNFHYPIADGTLPVDKLALFDVWKEIFLAVTQNQLLSQFYDIRKIFEEVAEMGGARNIESMRIGMGSDQQIQQGVQSGNLIPLNGDVGQALGGNSTGARNGIRPSPRELAI